MFLRFTASLQLMLVVGMLLVPGLSAVDFCLSEQRCCEADTARPCCCDKEDEAPRRGPCCVTVQREWMLPFKDRIGEPSPASFVLPEIVQTEVVGFVPIIVDGGADAHAIPDPPPLPRVTRLALLQSRLV